MSDDLHEQLDKVTIMAAVALFSVVCFAVLGAIAVLGFIDDINDLRKKWMNRASYVGPQGPPGPTGERGPQGTIDRTADRGWVMDLIREQAYIDIRAEVQEQLEIRERYQPGNVLAFGDPSAPPAYPGKE